LLLCMCSTVRTRVYSPLSPVGGNVQPLSLVPERLLQGFVKTPHMGYIKRVPCHRPRIQNHLEPRSEVPQSPVVYLNVIMETPSSFKGAQQHQNAIYIVEVQGWRQFLHVHDEHTRLHCPTSDITSSAADQCTVRGFIREV
jgi:hypothetical protein